MLPKIEPPPTRRSVVFSSGKAKVSERLAPVGSGSRERIQRVAGFPSGLKPGVGVND
jgi:hypothetical protein